MALAEHPKAAMKIRVQHRDGTIETLNLRGVLHISEGQQLSHFSTEDGIAHYFTPDGYYDGWESRESPQHADEITQEIEVRREFEDSGDIPATH